MERERGKWEYNTYSDLEDIHASFVERLVIS